MDLESMFKEYNKAGAVFDPAPSYSGIWNFNLDNLIRNSKKENNKNLFQSFYNNTYKIPLKKIFKTSKMLNLYVGMSSRPNENNIGRCLTYSKQDFFTKLTIFLNQKLDRFGKDEEEYNKYIDSLLSNLNNDNETLHSAYSKALRQKGKIFENLIEKEINSPYYDIAMEEYNKYKRFTSFSEYLKTNYEIIDSLQKGILELSDFFDIKINYDELYNCFEPDKFYLLFAKIIYENNLKLENMEGHLNNNYGYLVLYNNILNEIKKNNKEYNPSIKYILDNGDKITYTSLDFQKEFSSMLDKNPAIKNFKIIAGKDIDKYKNINLMENISNIYNGKVKENWIVFDDLKKLEQNELDNKEINNINMKIEILKNSGYINSPFKGIGKCNNYYGFIYPNGKVLLEKIFSDEEKLVPATGEASYIMSIDNFVEMNKNINSNISEYVKTLPTNGFKRIFHTSINNWQRNLYNEINGTYRLEDVIEFIDTLRNEGKSHE